MENLTEHTNRKQKQILLHVAIWAVFICFSLMQPRNQSQDIFSRLMLISIGNIALFYINYSYLVTHYLLKKKNKIVCVVCVYISHTFNLII